MTRGRRVLGHGNHLPASGGHNPLQKSALICVHLRQKVLRLSFETRNLKSETASKLPASPRPGSIVANNDAGQTRFGGSSDTSSKWSKKTGYINPTHPSKRKHLLRHYPSNREF